MMNLKGFAKAASVAAMTVGVAFAATPAQKASAQVVGAGASSVTTLADYIRNNDVNSFATSGSRYIVTGSGTGRSSFLAGDTQFAAADGLGSLQDGVDDGTFVAFQEATLNVAFPYNVVDPFTGDPFTVNLTNDQAFAIINGDIVNWSEVGGPDLPIIRVARGDNSGTTQTLLNTFGGDLFPNPPAADGSDLPNPNGNEIVVAPAQPDPFTAADASGDDDNSGSYTEGVIQAIQNNNGAIGYTETAAANASGLPIAFDTDTQTSTIAIGPTFVVFLLSDLQSNPDVQNACLAFTDADNVAAAGFSADEIGPDAVSGGNPGCFQ